MSHRSAPTQTDTMRYHHTQEAPLHYLLFAVFIGELVTAWGFRDNAAVFYLLCGISVLLLFLWLSFQNLTVEDRGDHLLLYFGITGLFRARFPYDRMTDVTVGRSCFADGLGIHYTLKGWIFNIWGYDCVEIRQGQKLTRIGTDEPEKLAEFLRTQIPRP